MKPFPCHRTTHAAVEAALYIVAEEPIPPEEIQRSARTRPSSHPTVEVSAKPFMLGKTPQVDAQISIPYTVAAALLRRRIGLSDFEESAVRDLRVLALAAKVHVAAEPGDGEWTPMEVSMQYRGGMRRVHRVDRLLGTPERPLGESELIAKVRD
jgi:2-methylcitrate dehydratase PrpD